MFANKNIAEEHKPWANIIVSAPLQPHLEHVIIPAMSSPICPIDEYAIRAFKSGWRKQITLVKIAPHIHRGDKILLILLERNDIKRDKRINP